MIGSFSDHDEAGGAVRSLERWQIDADGTATRIASSDCGVEGIEDHVAMMQWQSVDENTIELAPVDDLERLLIRRIDCSTAIVIESRAGLPDQEHEIHRGDMCLEPIDDAPCPPDEACDGAWCATVWCGPPPICEA